MGLGIPALRIKIMLESDPLKPTMSVGRLGIFFIAITIHTELLSVTINYCYYQLLLVTISFYQLLMVTISYYSALLRGLFFIAITIHTYVQ